MSHPRAILGLSAYYHDSAAALLVDGQIVAAAQLERFTRKKHDERFPTEAIRYVLQEGGFGLDDLEAVVFYEKPFLKFERLLETYHAFAPRGLLSYLTAMPVWLKEKLFTRNNLKKALAALGARPSRLKLLFPEHHMSHAASAFYPSPFEEAAILTVDGVGEWATTTIGRGRGADIELLRELTFPHSLGLLYSAFTAFCGFKVNSGEYKLMGLAPYGDPDSQYTKRYKEIILKELVDLREDGSFVLNMRHFSYATGLRMFVQANWQKLFGLPPRAPEGKLGQSTMDLALAIQQTTEEIIVRMARTARELTGCDKLCLAGGVALNCVANGKLLRSGLFDDVWIQPAAGDAGGALGAAYAAWHQHFGVERAKPEGDAMRGAYLGPAFDEAATRRMARRHSAPFERFADFDLLCERVSELLAAGQVVGWHQGRMEFGPRALGNRSILGDPRLPDMQKKLNLKIKYREGFRPFAPSVLEESIGEVFELDRPSPYMLLVAPVRADRRKPLPEGYADLPMYERLYHLRSDLPSITHVDYSARIQSVHRETNPRYHQLIDTFRRRENTPLLVNTSFNVRGEPIVCTPEDAYRCFMRTEMDTLVIGDLLFSKTEQPELPEDSDWMNEFELD